MLEFIKKLFGFGKKETGISVAPSEKYYVNIPKEQGEKALGEVMASYKDDVKVDETLGTVTINGSSHIPYTKNIWLGQTDGKPEIETITIPVGGRTKEEAEKALQDRITEIDARKATTPIQVPVKAEVKVEKKTTTTNPKPTPKPKTTPKKTEVKVEVKPKTETKTKEKPKAKPAPTPKKDTKKGEK